MSIRKMQTFFSLLIAFAMLWMQCSENIHAEDKEMAPKQLYARSAVLMDADSGRILFEKDGNVVRSMASTTKIMTCILALEEGNPDQVVAVSKEACRQPQVRLGVRLGESYLLKDLLYSMMLESHNDSAVLVAESIGGSVKKFTEKMNVKARQIGCHNTNFVTPNGLDGTDENGEHGTSAGELAKIFRYCISKSPKKDAFLKLTRKQEYSFQNIEKTRSFVCHNHNAFLKMMDGALSGKTGFTAKAGYCYVGALRKDDRTFIVALLACGWPGNRSYKWADTRKLMEYGISSFTLKKLPGKEGIPVYIKDAKNSGNPYRKGQYIVAHIENKDKKVMVKAGENWKIKTDIPANLHAPIKKGAQIGEARYQLGEKIILTCPVLADEGVQAYTWQGCLQLLVRKLFL